MGDFPADFGVLVIVKIVTIGIKYAVSPESKGLMDLEIKTN